MRTKDERRTDRFDSLKATDTAPRWNPAKSVQNRPIYLRIASSDSQGRGFWDFRPCQSLFSAV